MKITHPFHPLTGKSFKLLKSKKWEARDHLSLYSPEFGSIAIPREWTSLASPRLFEDAENVLALDKLIQINEALKMIGG